ncbi:hypothetical protein GCM10023189_42910 [Nibrella saemangeumensis]|uniref:Rad52/22 family double-strand break repair protein n=1 Tax=Nibrella saemangeumensis TaxID=1084526 RepID=A0ABP8NER1_9BACT
MNTALIAADRSPKLDILLAPLKPNEVEWRVASTTKDNSKLIVVPYITNRCVMQRFDEQFGWDRWRNEIREVDGGFLCTITVVLDGGEAISKTDGANRTDIEPVKGGISDAMKRAAVQFGLGRELYDYPKVMIELSASQNGKFIPDWAHQLLDRLVIAAGEGRLDRDVYVLKESQARK